MVCSIFIAPSFNSASPLFTRWPPSTRFASTTPGIGARNEPPASVCVLGSGSSSSACNRTTPLLVWTHHTRSGVVRLHALELLPEPRTQTDAGGSLRAPMPGVVLANLVEGGQRVNKGDALLKLGAMKMEH